ncbi:GNAT family N-acetyltransferase [bacterium]|nr:MAG: GNAT family N-acetyltransferase [bacterium]
MAFGCQMSVSLDDGRTVELKPFTREDVSDAVGGMQRYSNLKWLSTNHAQTIESEQAWYDHIASSTDEVIFGVHIDNQLIGSFGLHRIADRRGTAGAVMFSRDHQEMGIGTAVTRAGLYYAVQVLDMVAIDSAVLSMNVRSLSMQESAGFVVTGRKLRCHIVDGRPCDELIMVWINPNRHTWQYIWRNTSEGKQFVEARKRAWSVLSWAEEHVTLL